MRFPLRRLALWCVVWLCVYAGQAPAQSPPDNMAAHAAAAINSTSLDHLDAAALAPASRVISPTVALYFDPLQGASSNDFVRRALSANGELAAARLEATRARARLLQAGLRPNPTIDFEQTTGRVTGSVGESQTSIGVALLLETGGRRRRRIELARAELEATEAEIANRERLLAVEVRALYAEALAALRDLETTEGLTNLDLQTVRVAQIRVNEGEIAPLELSLLQTEVERLRSRRALVEGRLRSALIRLKNLAGVAPEEPLRLREELAALALPVPPKTLDAAVEIALRTRPDLRFARLNEEVAQAGLRLAGTLARPDVTAFGRFNTSRSVFDDTPVGPFRDKGQTLTFGASVSIPIFNRNQGAKAEAAAAISQAKLRREFLESLVRADVSNAYARYEAARAALLIFEQGVIERSQDNIRTVRAAYELGHFSITELLAEQRRLADSQREFTEALAERYRALADLQAAIGAPAGQPE